MKKSIDLSVVIPVYNEGGNIILTIKEIIRHIRVPYEILIIYDFDEDTTIPVVSKKLKRYKNIFLIKNTIARGPSGAIHTGIKKSRGKRILVTMADLCDDLSQINELLDLVPNHADIACPSRYSKGGRQELKAGLKVWAPRTAGFLLKILAGIPTYDPTNSYKLYSKEVLEKMNLKSIVSFSITLEIVVRAHALGFTIVDLPTVWRDRQHGKTNFKLGRSLVAYLPWFCYALVSRLFRNTRN